MSNRPRLLLLSGVESAGTTAACVATLEALADEGINARLVDATSAQASRPAVLDLVAATLGRVMADLGADPVHRATWDALPGIAHLCLLHDMIEALSESDVRAVVVDCGDLAQAAELVGLPAVLLRLLDSALTPRLAMWRAPVQQADPGDRDTAFEALSRARSDVVRLQRTLAHPSTTMRLVTVAADWAVSRTLHAASVFPLLGVGVDGIIVNRFPRKSQGWPRDVVDEHSAQLDRLRRDCEGVEVWKSGDRIRAVPKGRSAMGPLGRVHVLDVEQITVRAGDEEYFLDVPLVGAAAREAAVGRLGDDLVVEFAGVHRLLPLPPLLRRCVATHAVRAPNGLTVSFVPDPTLWRSDSQAAS